LIGTFLFHSRGNPFFAFFSRLPSFSAAPTHTSIHFFFFGRGVARLSSFFSLPRHAPVPGPWYSSVPTPVQPRQLLMSICSPFLFLAHLSVSASNSFVAIYFPPTVSNPLPGPCRSPSKLFPLTPAPFSTPTFAHRFFLYFFRQISACFSALQETFGFPVRNPFSPRHVLRPFVSPPGKRHDIFLWRCPAFMGLSRNYFPEYCGRLSSQIKADFLQCDTLSPSPIVVSHGCSFTGPTFPPSYPIAFA